jgi:hypothetical protein
MKLCLHIGEVKLSNEAAAAVIALVSVGLATDGLTPYKAVDRMGEDVGQRGIGGKRPGEAV